MTREIKITNHNGEAWTTAEEDVVLSWKEEFEARSTPMVTFVVDITPKPKPR